MLAALALLATMAPAPARVDRETGVRFDLEGTVLTLSLTRPEAGEKLWGKRINAVCSPVFSAHPSRRIVHATQLWPEGATELSYTFERDISAHVKWCLLEDADRGGDVAGVQFEPYFPVYADTPKQRRIGRELRHYLVRNAGDESWIWKVSGIVVQRGVIAVATELRRNRYGKRVARDICRLIQGADVADFTPGHTVYGRNEIKLRTCRAREKP